MNICRATAILVVLFNIELCRGYSGGAPMKACKTLLPEHDHPAQDTPSPYELKIDINGGDTQSLTGGDPVRVTLAVKEANPDKKFKGFILSGKKSSSADKTSVGTFQANDKDVQLLMCGSEDGDAALTHTNAKIRDHINATWLAAYELGEFVIEATVVENYDTFWKEIISEKMTITKAGVRPTTPKPVGAGKEFYNGCGKTQGCFGLPDKCVQNKNCKIMAAYQMEKKPQQGVVFKLFGNAQAYVSVGLSFDNKMGEDVVFGCRLEKNAIKLGHYYNPKKSNEFVGESVSQESVMKLRQGKSENGVISCEFEFNSLKAKIPGRKRRSADFDLKNGKFYILVSKGPDASTERLGYHPTPNDRGASSESLKLDDYRILENESQPLYKVHGILMLIAWVFLAPIGMIIARYGRQTFFGVRVLQLPIWLGVHIIIHGLSCLIGLISFIIIFVQVDGYTPNPLNAAAETFHPILGIIVTVLTVTQVSGGIFRPTIDSILYPYFCWIHWCTGIITYVLSLVTIILANSLKATGLNESIQFYGVIGSFILIHVCMYVLLGVHTIFTDREMGADDPTRPFKPGTIRRSATPGEAPGMGIHVSLFGLEIIAALVTTVYLSILIAQGSG